MAERPDAQWVLEKTALDPKQTLYAIRALVEDGLLDGIDVSSAAGPDYLDLRLTRTGRDAIDAWSHGTDAVTTVLLAQVVEVLIASPSDTSEARDRVEQAIHEWNGLHAVEQQVILLPRRWERDAHARMGARPQAILNPQIVDRSHILIGIFATRLGTPSGIAESGTVEEIESFAAAGKPTHLYFSKESIPADVDISELERLRSYKAKLLTEGLLGEFDTVEDLARQVTVALNVDVRELRGHFGTTPAVGVALERPNLVIDYGPQNRSSTRVTLRNAGSVVAENVVVRLDGALLMVGSDGKRIRGDEIDEVGDLAPGSTRSWNIIGSAQTSNGRVRVTADGIEPFEVDVE